MRRGGSAQACESVEMSTLITNGWAGRRVVVNLHSREIDFEEIPHAHLRRWIGGRALNVLEIRQRTVPGLDAFNTDSPLCMAAGPLAGTLAPCSAALHLAARSPAAYPSTIAMAEIAGAAGPMLKLAGFDQIVILGESDKPVCLVVSDGTVEFRDASKYWGFDPASAAEAAKRESGKAVASVLSIGIAGENEVRFATVTADCSWPAEAPGLGAVMGARRLKAVVLAGSGPMRACHGPLLREKAKDVRHVFSRSEGIRALSRAGTLFPMDWIAGSGALAERNFNAFPAGKPGLGTEEYLSRFKGLGTGCWSCPVDCGRFTGGEELTSQGIFFGGLRFEAAMSVALRLGLGRWIDVLKVCHECMKLGMDPASFASLAAWLTDCYERGMIDARRTGRVMAWGDVESVLAMAAATARREGHGRFFGEGSLREAKRSTDSAERLLPHVAGFDWPALDPRVFKGLSLSFATAPHDAGPLTSLACPALPGFLRFSPGLGKISGRESWDAGFAASWDGKAGLLAHARLLACAAQMAGVCRLPAEAAFAVSARDLAEMLYAVTGEEFDADGLIAAAAAVMAAEWDMMVKEGLGLDVLRPPARFFAEPVPEGPFAGEVLREKDFAGARGEYIDAVGRARGRGGESGGGGSPAL